MSSLFQEFLHSPVFPVMVISYEMFVRYVEDIRKIKFDLVICDEAHRLKNAAIKTTMVRSSWYKLNDEPRLTNKFEGFQDLLNVF